ncbi:hypothetical protein HE1_00915 [Holospora elegans E1]|uniref:Tc1-like transposase DDE domain-containing protein n=1 Tax=Holospora elegans E1 TaxID=1427503 RepID=A0A023DZT3_9PROT|nr:hypothetical protein HE1_00915 [Holospora elegans E1]
MLWLSYLWGAKGGTNPIGALIGKSINCNWFDIWLTQGVTSWVQQILLPNLPKENGSVTDNSIINKGKAVQKMLKDAGNSLLYFPHYSPDLNSIEKKWPQAKHIRRTLTCSIDHLFQFHFS